MYLHVKQGFVEADRYDGTPLPTDAPKHVRHALSAAKRRAGAFSADVPIIVVRSRERDTLRELLAMTDLPDTWAVASPPAWDYEWRCFLSAVEFREVLHAVVRDLDYRNFKSWCAKNDPGQSRLAHDIWRVAHGDSVSSPHITSDPPSYDEVWRDVATAQLATRGVDVVAEHEQRKLARTARAVADEARNARERRGGK